MKPFVLDPSMLTLGGVFYPTGHMFVMFPTLQDARSAEHLLMRDGYKGEVSLLTPQDIQEQVARTVTGTDAPLPSPGTEGETVRHYIQLAEEGHHALLIHAPSSEDTQHVMKVLKQATISYAQKYRHLVIEDLVE